MPSSVIKNFYYEKETTSLIVIFVSGLEYRYKKMPEKTYLKMKEAYSKGVFLNNFIKGNFDFEKLND